jgi:hypothetical protein
MQTARGRCRRSFADRSRERERGAASALPRGGRDMTANRSPADACISSRLLHKGVRKALEPNWWETHRDSSLRRRSRPSCRPYSAALSMGRPITVRRTGSVGGLCDSLRPLRASAATPVRCRYRCGSSSAGQRRRSTSGSARSNSGSSAPRTRRSESCSTRAGCAGSATVSPSTGSSATSSASPTRARCRGAQLVPHEATPRETRADHHSHAVCVEHGDAFIGETAARDVERMS